MGTEMRTDVSVIIPTYKRPEKLERALASVKPACSVAYELIVVDDCPEGSGYATAKAFGAQYVCKAGRNRGLSRSRNIGLVLAGAERLAFLDDDDFFAPGGLDALYLALMNGCSFAFGNYLQLFSDKQTPMDLSELTQQQMLVGNQIPVGAYMISRGSVRRGFDEQMRSHEDWEFLLSNINWHSVRHVAFDVVTIDKTENQESSMQARRRSQFWLDYLSVYSRFPAPELSQRRQKVLAMLGVNLDPNMLKHGDSI